MKPEETKKICEVAGGRIIHGSGSITVGKIFQDSRLVENESGFFAIAGASFDGHDYLMMAAEKGAVLLVADDIDKAERFLEEYREKKGTDYSGCIVLVEDTQEALVKVAEDYLAGLNVKKIAVTGSCGKTSTRDMIYYCLGSQYKAHRNQGNFNTLVGVSLTILDMDPDVEVAVFEMGMDKAGEIREISRLVRPDIAAVTNIGVSHLENFSSRDGIFHAKMEIADGMSDGGILVVSEDDMYLNRERLEEYFRGRDLEIIVTGDRNSGADVYVSDIEEHDDLTVGFTVSDEDGESCRVELPVPGRHNAFNCVLAMTAAREAGVPFASSAEGIAHMKMTGKRLSIEEGNGIKVINDTYNANPLSMKAAIDILAGAGEGRKIAVLGDMYELGQDEIRFHQEVGEYAREKGITLYTIGDLAEHMNGDIHFRTKEEFMEKMDQLLESGDTVLIKASHGMALDSIAEKISGEGK